MFFEELNGMFLIAIKQKQRLETNENVDRCNFANDDDVESHEMTNSRHKKNILTEVKNFFHFSSKFKISVLERNKKKCSMSKQSLCTNPLSRNRVNVLLLDRVRKVWVSEHFQGVNLARFRVSSFRSTNLKFLCGFSGYHAEQSPSVVVAVVGFASCRYFSQFSTCWLEQLISWETKTLNYVLCS